MNEYLVYLLNRYKSDFNRVIGVQMRSNKDVNDAVMNLINALWWAYADKYPEFKAWTEKKVLSGDDDPNMWKF